MNWSINAMGSPFDMNGDGKLDTIEQSLEMMYLNDNAANTSNSRRDEIEEVLAANGYSLEDLDDMDPEEVREMLEDAGIELE